MALFDECDIVDDDLLSTAFDEVQQHMQLPYQGGAAPLVSQHGGPAVGMKRDAPWHPDSAPPGQRPFQGGYGGGGGFPGGGSVHARPPPKGNGPPPPQPLGNFNRNPGPGGGAGYGGPPPGPPQSLALALRPSSPVEQQLQPHQQQQRLPDVPSSAIFNKIQATALECLSPGDYHVMGGRRFIKKSGWRRLAMFFGISLEIRTQNETCDAQGNIVRATFVVRGTMASGRFSDAYGSCDRSEKRFQAPNRDIPATAETRASSRAIQNLLGINE